MEHEIAEAVRQILIQLHRLTDLGLPPQRIDRIRRETIFFLYEGGERDKWSFERPHSAAARALHRDARARGVRFSGSRFPVTYDHAIPLVTLRDGLRNATISGEQMRDFLLRHVQGVVILKEENAKLSSHGMRDRLPPGAPVYDLMARYRIAKIEFEPDDVKKLERGIPS